MIDRRHFIRSSAFAALGFVIACSKKALPKKGGTLDAIRAGRPQKLTMKWSDLEVLARPGERLTFTLADPASGQPVKNATGNVWLATDNTKDTAVGPFPIRGLGNGFENVGLYIATVAVPTEGNWTALVDARVPGSDAQIGGTIVRVGSSNQQIKPDARAPKIATPTSKNPRGVKPYCTREPACSMHNISLADALKNGKPTVVIVATPAFCESRLCGPEVDILQSVAEATGTAANFIHIEVYRDDEADTIRRHILSPAAAAWNLEIEPATYWIEPGGMIRDRALGPLDAKGFLDATRALVG